MVSIEAIVPSADLRDLSIGWGFAQANAAKRNVNVNLPSLRDAADLVHFDTNELKQRAPTTWKSRLHQVTDIEWCFHLVPKDSSSAGVNHNVRSRIKTVIQVLASIKNSTSVRGWPLRMCACVSCHAFAADALRASGGNVRIRPSSHPMSGASLR